MAATSCAAVDFTMFSDIMINTKEGKRRTKSPRTRRTTAVAEISNSTNKILTQYQRS